jgi:hypothetical protein
LDLKDYLEENDLTPSDMYVDLKDLYSVFGEDEQDDREEEISDE